MKAFISYSHIDKAALDHLHEHLAVLKRVGKIQTWYDRDILAGDLLDDEITANLADSQVFIGIVSPSYLNSNYVYDKEFKEALRRQGDRSIRIIAVIYRPCMWQETPLRRGKAVPDDGRPIVEWPKKDRAWLRVVEEIKRVIDDFEKRKAKSAPEPRPTIPAQARQPTQDMVREQRPSQSSGTNARRKRSGIVEGQYGIKRDFSDVDIENFRQAAFETIRNYFEKAIKSVSDDDKSPLAVAEFTSIGENDFTCTVVKYSEPYRISVFNRNQGGGSGDISFDIAVWGDPSTINGWFTVESDDYSLHLRPHLTRGMTGLVSPEQAAQWLWRNLLQVVGVDLESILRILRSSNSGR